MISVSHDHDLHGSSPFTRQEAVEQASCEGAKAHCAGAHVFRNRSFPRETIAWQLRRGMGNTRLAIPYYVYDRKGDRHGDRRENRPQERRVWIAGALEDALPSLQPRFSATESPATSVAEHCFP